MKKYSGFLKKIAEESAARLLFSAMVLQLIVSSACQAQPQAQAQLPVPNDTKPATSNVSGAQYPRIFPDNRAIFRLKAPDAKKVQLQIDKTYDMVKDNEGIWTVTTVPQSPGFHYYSIVIDGLAVADPGSESFFGMSRMASGIEIPEPGVDYYTVKNVPHGDIRLKSFYSSTTNSWRGVYIYTPPGYDIDLNKKYPVLYILHGGGEDERGWAIQGKTDIIIDNAIAEQNAKPMLVVMLDGNIPRIAGTNSVTPTISDEILKSLIPFIESNFRVLADSKNRALAGLSMGGIQTLDVGLKNTDVFGYIGVLSSGWFANQSDVIKQNTEFLEKNSSTIKKNLKLLWIGVGGKDDIAYANCQNMMKMFDASGIKYTYYDRPGGHAWPVWRDDLHLMAPLLFK